MGTLEAVQALRATPPGELGDRTASGIGRGYGVRGLELWRGDYCVCVDLSVAVRDGQLVHLRGPNGAGKTSLLRVLAGLALPDAGEILLDGEPVLRNRNAWRADLSYVGHSDGVKRELTPYENLRLAARLGGAAPREDLRSALERVGLATHADRLCGELSAGQRRRTALARLLISTARIWLLDEPVVSLDRAGVRLVEALLREHLEAGGIAMIATHQPLNLTGLEIVPVDLPQIAGSC